MVITSKNRSQSWQVQTGTDGHILVGEEILITAAEMLQIALQMVQQNLYTVHAIDATRHRARLRALVLKQVTNRRQTQDLLRPFIECTNKLM